MTAYRPANPDDLPSPLVRIEIHVEAARPDLLDRPLLGNPPRLTVELTTKDGVVHSFDTAGGAFEVVQTGPTVGDETRSTWM